MVVAVIINTLGGKLYKSNFKSTFKNTFFGTLNLNFFLSRVEIIVELELYCHHYNLVRKKERSRRKEKI